MFGNKKILAIIPARGGSKGLPEKNIKLLCGKPLIGWTIEQAKGCKYIDSIFVTTDCQKIANIAGQFGLNVPFLRPPELAEDTSSSMDVVVHVLEYYRTQNVNFDYVLLLEPTSPLRKRNDLDSAVKLAIGNESADGVVSLGEVHMEHPMIVKQVDNDMKIRSYIEDVKRITQRQMADKAFFPYGVIYMIKTEVFNREKSFYTNNIIPYFIERWQNYEVDDIYDFIVIEAIMNNKMEDII
ncbi:MAG: acylneuraminate cytidylyltransferase family protein [Bacteroidales bacterium]|nr:acylneuraminate cytidylyltransferase family protein [Bacteroidales bacterium]